MQKLLNFKIIFLLLLASISTTFFTGCASSKRMSRVSPWQKDINKSIESKEVNLWPVYYYDNNATSILWPMIDIDSRGFGIRPFFNKEGDEYSISINRLESS